MCDIGNMLVPAKVVGDCEAKILGCADMLKALAMESIIVVNGLSGSGDTQDLTRCWMEHHLPFPFPLYCSTYASHNQVIVCLSCWGSPLKNEVLASI